MPSVHGVNCTFVHGQPKALGQRVDTFQVPGIDGYGAQLLGQGNAEFRFVAVLLDTKAGIDTWTATIRLLQGTIGTVIDDRGVSHTNMLIVDTSQPSITAALYTTTQERAAIVIQGVKQR